MTRPTAHEGRPSYPFLAVRRLPLSIGLLLAALAGFGGIPGLAAPKAPAAETQKTPPTVEREKTVYVPYEKLQEIFE